jgi:hypothetical protein
MAKKKRKSRASKSAVVPFLIFPIIMNPCVARDEKKDIEDRHVETRQYRASPGLVGHAWDAALASTATVTTSYSVFHEQFL